MSYEIKGRLVDQILPPPNGLSNYTIKIFDDDPINDDEIKKVVTLDDGSFRILFKRSDFKKSYEFWDSDDPQIYFKIYDLDGKEIKVTNVVTDPFVPYTIPNELNQCESIVVGSGFGGTITSLSLVKKYLSEDGSLPDSQKRKIILLERGQWWVSHELPASPSSHEFEDTSKSPLSRKGIREFLEFYNLPYNTWPYPDNLNGLFEFLGNLHNGNNRYGLLDYRISKKVHTLTASGVGGGSLIYTNVTEEPNEDVINSWKNNLDLGIDYSDLLTYFKMARGFIGVNKIATNASIGDVKLPRSKAFHDSVNKIKKNLPAGTSITNKVSFDPSSSLVEDIFAVDLSISDIPYRKDEETFFKKAKSYNTIRTDIQNNNDTRDKVAALLRKYNIETNQCQRQGRCAIGCIPGARHTNNKKLFEYLRDKDKGKHFEVRALAEVYDIEPLNGGQDGYRVYYNDYGARESKEINISWTSGTQSFKLNATLFRRKKNGVEKSIECKTLILAAGALGSTEILLKSINTTRSTGQKLKLSDRLGKGYSTNGDLLGIVTSTKSNIYATRGPMVTSAIKFKNSQFMFTIEDTGIPKMFSGLSNLLTQVGSFRELLSSIKTESIDLILGVITKNLAESSTNLNSGIVFSEDALNKTLILSGMGTDTHDGEIKVSDSWKNNPNRDMNSWNVLNVDFDLNKLAPLYTEIRTYMEKIAKDIGEKGSASFITPLWDPNPAKVDKNLTAVVHNLGGCSMGKDRSNGVVNNLGKIYKGDGVSLVDTYDKFYVVDGAIIPTSLGVNPSLTISALAFRIAKEIVQSNDFLPVEEVTIGTENMYFSN